MAIPYWVLAISVPHGGPLGQWKDRKKSSWLIVRSQATVQPRYIQMPSLPRRLWRIRSFMRTVFRYMPISMPGPLCGLFTDLLSPWPIRYFDNTAGMRCLEVMHECKVHYIVLFFNCCHHYGIPEEIPILETTPTKTNQSYSGASSWWNRALGRQAYGIVRAFVTLMLRVLSQMDPSEAK